MAEKKAEKKAENLNIHQKMLEVMKSIERLQKDTPVEYNGRKQYSAMSEEKVTSTVRAKFIEQGLIMYPFEQEISKDGSITTTNTKYRLVNVDNPEESIVIASSGQGADTQDKGSGKAMTYSFKYALLRTFAIPTGEDPDKIHSDELTDTFKEEEAKAKNEADSKKHQQKVEKLKAEAKALMEETKADVNAFLVFFSDKFERKIENVDMMVEPELHEAIKLLKQKKEEQGKMPKPVAVDVKGAE